MDTYQKIVLAVAASVLLLYLLTVGFMMRRDDSEKPWPPVAGRCPDNWTEEQLNICYPKDSSNFGNLKENLKENSIDFKDYSVCEKKKWGSKYQVKWEGITNYNKCK